MDDLGPIPSELRGGVVSVGNFDGVHCGHRALIARLVAQARAGGHRALAVTFEPHPQQIFAPSTAPAPLTWLERRGRLLLEAGAEEVIVFRSGLWLFQLSASEFLDRVLGEQLGVAGLVEGHDFRFGRDRTGDASMLTAWAHRKGLSCEIVPPIVEPSGRRISSTEIRAALERGALEEANTLLGSSYRIRGLVTHGAGRGRGLGVPTANLDRIDTMIPADGVYAVRARILPRVDGPPTAVPVEEPVLDALPVGAEAEPAPIASACNIGPNPTFGEQIRKVEAHLIDFDGDLYGRTVELEFVARIRDTRRFDGLEDLKGQIARDIEEARRRA